MEEYDKILSFWFGHVEETIVPSEHRARIWFSDDSDVDNEIREQFKPTLDYLSQYDSVEWNKNPRAKLASIIILDQFSRHIYRNTAKAYENDKRALELCLNARTQEADHKLSLIERVFFYFPLIHSEQLAYQEEGLIAYTALSELAFDETKVIFHSFLKFANHHYSIIEKYGRFPQRNTILGRKSTPEEEQYLHDINKPQ